MNDDDVGLLILFFIGAFVGSCTAAELQPIYFRSSSCTVVCAPAKVHDSSPSMCVCDNGKTFPGKRPEFYKK